MDDHPQPEPLFVVAILTIAPGAMDSFREFESHAARIITRHGGAIERTVQIESSDSDGQREVHLLKFPSKEAFARYRADQELAALAPMRSSAIARTEIMIGREGPRYSPLE